MEGPRLDGVRVLLIEDNDDSRELMRACLEFRGAVVRDCESVNAARQALAAEWRPQVVLSDIGLPEEDGFAFVDWVRAHPDRAIAAMPVIAVTAWPGSELRAHAADAGFVGYLEKPISPARLASEVARAVTEAT